MAEKLRSDKKRTILNDFLQKVMMDNPSFYYASTADIARAISNRIKLDINRLSIDDQILIKKLTVRDIEMILSIRS